MHEGREKIVLTGGPCTGKTSIINLLIANDYETVCESARQLMQEGEVRGTPEFQEKVFFRQLENERRIRSNRAFLDRSLVDIAVYSQACNLTIPNLDEAIRNAGYSHVFVLEPLSQYCTDTERTENREEALAVHETIIRMYEEYGFNLIRVPESTPVARLEAILLQLKGGRT